MNKRIKYVCLLVLLCFFIVGCNTKTIENNNQLINDKNDVIKKVDSLKIVIDNKEYSINLENNDTVKEFINMLPLNVTMNELNGNEKYVYLDKKLSSNPSNPKYINKGDVMLYGDNCLVIFYKSFNTSYNYTKIGHIDNLKYLEKGDIIVTISIA